MMLPSAHDLSYFLEVASSLNISRAAERLGISQPSLTLAMRRLEDSVGTQVLIRTKKGVTLTQAGKQLLAHARLLLETWGEVKSKALSSMAQVQGAFVLGCHPSVALCSLKEFLPSLIEKHQGLNITLKHDLSRKIAEGVISFQIDIGIVVNPVQHPDLIIQKLYLDKVTLWTGAGSRAIQDLTSGNGVIICDPELLQTQSLLKNLRKAKLVPKRTINSSSLEVIAELTAHGAGVGILPTRVANIARKKLTAVANAPVFHDEISLLYRVENKAVRSIQVITNSIKECFS